jgi:hypothetical protein
MKKTLVVLATLLGVGLLVVSLAPTAVKAQPPGCLNECAPAAEQAFRSCISDGETPLEVCQARACQAYLDCVLQREGQCAPAPGPVDPADVVPFCSTRDQ